MRCLFLGDVMGRAGRQAIQEHLQTLRRDWKLDFVVVNGENASNGAGLTGEHAQLLLEAGADCLTLGDHAFDKKDMLQAIEGESRIIRPINFAKGAPGRGHRLFTDARGRKILVLQVLGQVFMKRPFDDPFSAVDQVLRAHPLGGLAQAIIVDIHCEATSEKWPLAIFVTGGQALWLGPIPMCRPLIPRSYLAAPAFNLMPACAVITTASSVWIKRNLCGGLSLACRNHVSSRRMARPPFAEYL